MFRILCTALLVTAAVVPRVAAADGPTLSGTVRARGTPVAGATVWLRTFTRPGGEDPATATTDAQGRFTLPLGEAATARRYELIARDSAGRIGWHELYSGSEPNLEPAIRIDLHEVSEARGRVVDGAGQPIAGVRVRATSLSEPREDAGSARSHDVPSAVARHYEAVSAADGSFAVTGVPVGSRVVAEVSAPGRGPINAYWSQASPCELKLEPTGRARVRFRGADEPKKLAGLTLDLNLREQLGEVLVFLSKEVKADGSDTLDVSDLLPGRYKLSVRLSPQVPFVSPADFQHPVELTVPPGGMAEATVELRPAATVRGRVVNKSTGTGISGIELYVMRMDERQRTSLFNGTVVSDAEGRFVGHVSPGHQRLTLSHVRPADYVPPQGELVKPAEVVAGATFTFPDIPFEPTVSVEGAVEDSSGRPVPYVRVWAAHVGPSDQSPTLTDAQGRFTLRGLAKDETTALRARTDRAATNGAVVVDVAERGGPVRLTVTEAAACRLRGVVVDAAGQPLADAAVRVTWNVRGTGRSARYGFGSFLETYRTDADGRFETQALWGGDRYRVQATADSFGRAESAEVTAAAGQVHDLGRLVMTRTGGVIAGRVMDADGQPLAGVRVANSGDAPKALEATTDADGRFKLSGFFDGSVYLTARRDGYRFTLLRTRSGESAAVVRMLKAGDPPPAGPTPQAAAEHEAAVRKLTRDLQDKLWRLPREVTGGFERRIWEWTFASDPETARRWLSEERQRGAEAAATVAYADNLRRIADVEQAAAGDVEDAIAKLEPLKPPTAFNVLLKLSRHYQKTDPAKSLRLAEEATLRARAVDLPDRMWCLADIADLVGKLGRVESARKLVDQVAGQAESLGTENMQGYARGRVATVLAVYDLPRARKLVEPIAEESERKRWLASVAVRVAERDLAQAQDLLKALQPERSTLPQNTQLRMADRLAATRPADAVRLAESISDVRFQADALAGVAVRVAPRDPALARSLIDRALGGLLDEPDALRSWSNFGGASGLAAWIAYQARRAGHPDLDSVIAHVWALRPTGAFDSPTRLNEQLVNTALILALTDPPTARALVDRALPPGRPIPAEFARRRETLFVLALADPERAVGVIDQRIEAARKSKDGLSGSGLVELLHILTTPPGEERTHLVGQFGSVFHSLYRDED